MMLLFDKNGFIAGVQAGVSTCRGLSFIMVSPSESAQCIELSSPNFMVSRWRIALRPGGFILLDWHIGHHECEKIIIIHFLICRVLDSQDRE